MEREREKIHRTPNSIRVSKISQFGKKERPFRCLVLEFLDNFVNYVNVIYSNVQIEFSNFY